MDTTEEVVGAEPTSTEEVAGAELEQTQEVEVSDDGWGGVHPEDSLSDDLSTTEEAEPAEKTQKSPVQERIDTITREKKEAIAREAHVRNTNDFLLQELNKQKQAIAPPVPVPEAKEPVFKDYEEKYAEDSEKATREYLKDHQAFLIKDNLIKQENQAAVKTQQANMASVAQEFQTGMYNESVMKKYPDFQSKVFHPTVVFNDPIIRHYIMSSPQKYDIAYRLANDTELRTKLNSSSQAEAGMILGDLQRLYASPPNKRFKSKAGKVISPVGSENRASEPKEEDMDMDSFLKREEKKMAESGGW